MWTLFDAQGYIVKNGIDVVHYKDGTTRINATLHLTENLIVTGDRIESKMAGWYLARKENLWSTQTYSSVSET